MAETKTARPLSPHLQIYRPMLTMMMSIVHRITGLALAGGMLLLVWWIAAAASNNDVYFDWVQAILGSWPGRVVLLGFSWALIHHALGGVRHLVWDTGRGFDLKTVELMARANLVASLVLTLVLWLVGYGVRA